MRLLVTLFILSTFYIGADTRFFNSNKTGMKLTEIDSGAIGDYYLVEETDFDNSSKVRSYFKKGILEKKTTEFFDKNFKYVTRVEVLKGNNLIVTIYKDSRVSIVENYLDDKIDVKEHYAYDRNNLLASVSYYNNLGENSYIDKYYRNKDRSLRKIIRTSKDGFLNYWYYQDGAIYESWHLDGESKIRTEFSKSGEILKKTEYINDEVNYEKDYIYLNKKLSETIKKEGIRTVIEIYNDLGLVLEKNILENDVLTKKQTFLYRGGYLIQEFIGGHGFIEEIFYTLDSEGVPILTEHFINKKLRSKIIKDGENSEIIEYYKNEKLYLKEYYTLKDRTKRELYLDGVLFKSENISE